MTASTPATSRAKRTTEQFDISKLAAYHRNPRVGNVPLIVESLKAHGQYKPLIVNRGSKTGRPNEVLAGNHLLRAGQELGLKTMEVRWLDVDDDEAARIVLVDNRSSDKGGYDNELLAELLQDIPSLDATGYSEGDLRRLLNGLSLGDEDGATDPDDVPSLPSIRKVKSKPGDVWLLGPHRLVVGDATLQDVLRVCAAGEVLDAMWTDPPYGVAYVGKTKEALTIQGDGRTGTAAGKDALAQLLHNAFTAAAHVLRAGAPVYVAHADTERIAFEGALRAAGYLVRQNLIWVKNTLVLGRSDYQYKHEPVLELGAPGTDWDAETGVLTITPDLSGGADVSRETLPATEPPAADVPAEDGPEPSTFEPVLYGFTPGASGRLGRGGEQWYGDAKQTTVFEVPKPPASREHPTMKPVDLIAAQLRNSTIRGQRVLDPFAGSGSTLLAAHRLGLVAHLIEIDPAYADVICRRYQEHTKIMPILESSGEGVDFVPAKAS